MPRSAEMAAALAVVATFSLQQSAFSDEPAGAAGDSMTTDSVTSVQPDSSASQAEAPAPPEADAWRSEFISWIWVMGMQGDVGARGRTAHVDANFGDILDASDSVFAFSGRLEVGRGPVAGFLDGIYAKLGAEHQSGPIGATDVEVTNEQAILDFGLMYRVQDVEPEGDAAGNRRNLTLDLYTGARYNHVSLELDPANLAARSRSNDWFDPIVGVKLVVPVDEESHFSVNGDVGGFGIESEFTWSLTAVLGHNFMLADHPSSIFAGYRAIGWDFSEGSGNEEFTWDVVQHGPILGLSIQF